MHDAALLVRELPFRHVLTTMHDAALLVRELPFRHVLTTMHDAALLVRELPFRLALGLLLSRRVPPHCDRATVQAHRDSPLAVNAPRSAWARRQSPGRAFTIVV